MSISADAGIALLDAFHRRLSVANAVSASIDRPDRLNGGE
jgi:hypothetical protein